MRPLSLLRLVLVLGSLLLAACIKTHDDDEDLPASAADASAVPAEEATDVKSGEASLGATLGCANYDEQSRQCLLLKVDYRVDAIAGGASARPALSIALVLDRSNAMRTNDKLADALAAAHWLVQNFTERDSLSIIAVDERATVLAAAGPVINKPFLHHRLGDVFANGTADLSAGLREAIAQLRSSGTGSERKAVLLLTEDTAARAQAANLEQLAKQTSEISVSTLALDKPEQAASALRAAIGNPLPIVARDAVIKVSMEEGHISKVYGELPIAPAQSQTVSLGDLRATEHGIALIQLEPAAFAFGTTVEARVSFEFADPLTAEKQSREIRLRSSYASEARRARDQAGAQSMLAGVLATLEVADAASRGLDLDRYREAKTSFAALREPARQYAMRSRDQELLNQTFVLGHIMDELDAAYAQGLLHDHQQAHARLPNERDYLMYLLTHHRE